MLNVLQSNQLEKLALRFATQASAASPLVAETVVVPNPGIARWLWLYLAKEHGISANLEFLLPGSFVWRVFHSLLADIPATSPHDPAIMTWRLHRLLLATKGDSAFKQLNVWRDTDDDRMRFELAQKLAGLFDQYIVYRPDWIKDWGAAETSGWQQTLWRRLAEETNEPDWLSLRRRLEELDPETIKAAMPTRVNVFGIPLLSPGYLDVLHWLSTHIDVNLFLPNPSQAYWADIVPSRDLGKMAGIQDEKALYLEEGNALLASWGLQARDLLSLVDEIENCSRKTEFVDPGNESLLPAIQSHILRLLNPGIDEVPAEPMRNDDRSLQVHVCHGVSRELEVLHDQLLALLDEDAALSASDIIVMTPDIDAYAPFIDAVFATSGKIPFNIADVSSRQADPLVGAFLSLFDLPDKRFDASSVLSILEMPLLRQRFGIGADEIPQVREWVRNTGVRWGLDARDRAEHGRSQPALHSWRHGLDRLMLGLALPGENSDLFAGLLPHDDVEGSAVLVLGGLAEFISRLNIFAQQLAEKRTARNWADWLGRQLDVFFAVPDELESESQKLRNVFTRLAEQTSMANHQEAIGSDIVIDWLSGQLQDANGGGGFLGYGVTFCGIKPMRNVPFPVVCLIGLNDTAFPRVTSSTGFDLIAKHPRRGDRSRRDDDRHAFLECVLNARQVLYLSYVGRDIRDDSAIPPSVLVSELLDYCDRAFVRPDGVQPSKAIVVLHKVQGFSQKYFDHSDPLLFSYNEVVSRRPEQQEPLPDFVDDLSPLARDELLPVSVDKLTLFFSNPAKSLLTNRLGVFYTREIEDVDIEDPVKLDALAAWSLGDWMLSLRMAGLTRDRVLEMTAKSRFAPAGTPGTVVLGKIMERVDRIAAKLEAILPNEPARVIAADWQTNGLSINGRLANLYPTGQHLWRFGKARAKYQLDLWIRHLALNVCQPDGIATTSFLISESDTLRLPPIDDAGRYLADIVDIYQAGMQRALPFFPLSSLSYVEAVQDNKDRSAALKIAKSKYFSDEMQNQFGDDQDPYIQRVFSNGVDWDEFAVLAQRIFDPMRQFIQ